jgi:flagellar biosynthesis/type III secretory pathway protein FliH
LRQGKVLDAADARRYRAPERQVAGERPPEELRVEEAVRAGFAEGLERGRAEARKALEQQREEHRQALEGALAEVARLEQEMVGAVGRQVTALAFRIAERIVRARIEADDEVACRIADEAMGRAAEGPRRLRAHAEDRPALERLVRESSAGSPIELVDDASLSRGSVVVECAGEEIDARIETTLALCRDLLAPETPA